MTFRNSGAKGEDFGNCHCYERLLNHMMDANETTRRCDSCDSCIAIFIHHLRLGDIVDVAATLRNCTLRDAIVQFHRNGVQYLTYHCFTLMPIDLVLKLPGTTILGKRNSKRCFIRWI